MNESPPVIIRLGVNKVDFNLGVPTDESIQPRLYTPGEEVSSQPDFLSGHGTYVDEKGALRASVAGVLAKVNKLISVRPLKARYNGEIGDLIVGRITEVQQKRWKVDINSKLDAVLLLSSVNLPGGELRRRSAEDEQTMRKYLQEKDLICAEVQSIFADGSLSLHTRVLKYGRLSQGMMLKVPSMLIQRTKTHYHTLENGATLILGCNGYVWIGASTQHVDKAEGGFTEDLSKLPLETYKVCWNRWIKICTRPKGAFLIVDVQNDFITGSLNIKQCAAQHDGSEVIEPINRLLETVPFEAVFYSLDWHPIDHVSFIDNLHLREVDSSSNVSKEAARVYDTVTFRGPPLLIQRLWPRHCVQDSWGAELHKDLKIVNNAIKIYKGTNPEVDSYSVFWDNKKLTETTLSSQLQEKGATDIYICGLAYDVCVGATAVDALTSGYRTILIDDCSRGVDLVDIEKTKATVIGSNGVIVNSSQVKAMVEGRDRRPELGYKLALEIKHKLKNYDYD
ncbi:exosome complex component RRP4 isoform X2 [Ooceraea biroi]|uniref:exosome complex component RRP4 isoform X2 n=1 Tax=Ooceraea biroi TaxID=2015173 RepID=UPI000F0960B0|nr:exosome complex component RRP4 isoform X2 [Ooceraea biroi]